MYRSQTLPIYRFLTYKVLRYFILIQSSRTLMRIIITCKMTALDLRFEKKLENLEFDGEITRDLLCRD